jgi:hypothetical protein
VYNFVPRERIADALLHLRELFRKVPPSSEQDRRAQERREILTKNLLSNLSRTKEHPTLNAVLDVADAFSLTLDGAHQLFGYELESIREYDSQLNAGRTHITAPSTKASPPTSSRAVPACVAGTASLRCDCVPARTGTAVARTTESRPGY